MLHEKHNLDDKKYVLMYTHGIVLKPIDYYFLKSNIRIAYLK